MLLAVEYDGYVRIRSLFAAFIFHSPEKLGLSAPAAIPENAKIAIAAIVIRFI
jgi:hypothetical protein